MSAETPNNIVNDDANKHESARLTQETPGPGFLEKRSVHIGLGLVLFLVLSLIILSVDDESDSAVPVPDGTQPASIDLSAPPAESQELPPRVLEDFRTAPTTGLEIQPQPILPPPPVEQGVEVDSGEEPSLLEQETVLSEDVPESGADAFSLGEALARYLIAMRDELNREYVENCIQFRSRNGLGAACPENPAFTAESNQKEKALVDELFSIITRRSDYARISRQLEIENEALTSILADPANPAASQASIKLALNNSYLDYLNGNPSPAVVTFERMNSFINDYNRTIMSGPVQFRCKGGPCIYEYTGPEAE